MDALWRSPVVVCSHTHGVRLTSTAHGKQRDRHTADHEQKNQRSCAHIIILSNAFLDSYPLRMARRYEELMKTFCGLNEVNLRFK
jgi:hypothetical protein